MGDNIPDDDSVLQIEAEAPLPPTPNDGYHSHHRPHTPRRPTRRTEAYPLTHSSVITDPPKSTMLATNDRSSSKWTWTILDLSGAHYDTWKTDLYLVAATEYTVDLRPLFDYDSRNATDMAAAQFATSQKETGAYQCAHQILLRSLSVALRTFLRNDILLGHPWLLLNTLIRRFKHHPAKDRKHITHTYLRRFRRKDDEALREWAFRCKTLISSAKEQGTIFSADYTHNVLLSGLPDAYPEQTKGYLLGHSTATRRTITIQDLCLYEEEWETMNNIRPPRVN
ncbi:hypothetical protein SARC_04909 [Sphaeroforma arctica JP610]|uniref:Uncharacterized protein n=1 Tax=Sphaeroforma arctica JP610 TaxID=667725 RepID=A0A0L0G1T8_9EUKA|nr:hypothetical protein SARC_04909 [Sphaeroforma arctica JP610]KNC82804.1 hypothetical protein SARC_04909 [Sphaeroforma arctica JP610]|eukprot:XP_014156706.1 hypothetical protein SARC_04909 [Sphaeroforma arctica JP610]